MKAINILTTSALLLISSTGWAQQGNPQNMDSSTMPMSGYMQHGPAMSPQQMEEMRQQRMQRQEMMMDSVMRQNMMQMRQQRMAEGGYMPMMGGRNGQMMMDPVMRQNMMQMRQQQMGQGMQGGMMNPQMMQMRQEHMNRMEQRLANIESLLQQLVEQQKGN